MMLDDLRNAASQPFVDEESSPSNNQPGAPRRRSSSEEGTFLGMTSAQRFIVSLFLLLLTCVLGSALLLLTQKVSLDGLLVMFGY